MALASVQEWRTTISKQSFNADIENDASSQVWLRSLQVAVRERTKALPRAARVEAGVWTEHGKRFSVMNLSVSFNTTYTQTQSKLQEPRRWEMCEDGGKWRCVRVRETNADVQSPIEKLWTQPTVLPLTT